MRWACGPGARATTENAPSSNRGQSSEGSVSSEVSSPYPPINDYALVGDRHSAALIARDGSVDWCGPGRFDAPAVFCRLLDAEKAVFWARAHEAAFIVDQPEF